MYRNLSILSHLDFSLDSARQKILITSLKICSLKVPQSSLSKWITTRHFKNRKLLNGFFKFQVSRFFGVTGTTSQDIQLGLTFTVPFLSIPLTSLQSALGGGGLSGIFDNFNFDVSSLVSIVVIVMLAIFVLPQVIYWLTGVNLSAFNWGRSK